MTERDAKVIAQIFLDYALREYQDTTGRWKSQAKSRSRAISVLEKTIAALEVEIPQAEKELEQLKTEVLYRSPQEAEQAIQELNRILTIAQVDIAGVRSAIGTIQDFQRENGRGARPVNQDLAKTLKGLLTEQAISLKAAQARESTAQGLRAQAIRFVELEEYLREGPDKLKQSRKDLNANETSLAKTNEDINSLTEPEVIDNQVTIYKITEKPEN